MNTISQVIVIVFPLVGLSPSLGAIEQGGVTPVTEQAQASGTATSNEQKQNTPSTFSPEKLEQMAAPIALYPDALVSQILMASTYPLEIVQAQRWMQQNSGLKGTGLEDALKTQDWDPSVKSLCGFPTVLKEMNDNLNWTQDLGDAFLGQKAEIMDTIQKMRRKAFDAGNLKTSEHQTVAQEDNAFIITPANPQVIYVPTYSPTVVYGTSWYYPTYYYPPLYVPPPPGYGFVAFSVGVAWGAALWGGCNWHGHDVNVNVNHYNDFNRVTNTNVNAQKYNLQNKAGDQAQWSHNPEHRQGVNYRSPQTAKQYGGQSGTNRVSPDQARGYDHSPTHGGVSEGALGAKSGAAPAARDAGNRPPTHASSGNLDLGPGQAQGAQRPSANAPENRAGNASADLGMGGSRASGGESSAFSGSRSPALDSSASMRGAASRGGGISRGGGGRR